MGTLCPYYTNLFAFIISLVKENIFRKIKHFSKSFSCFYNQMKLTLLKLYKGALAKTAAGFKHIQLPALSHSKK